MLTLRDLLKYISYTATLQLMETPREKKEYQYIFGRSDLILRGIIEDNFPELLDREVSDGIHGEGVRDGLYIHLYKNNI